MKMANEYVMIQQRSEGLGQIAVSNNVFNHIVAIVVSETKHVFFDDGTGKKSLLVRNAEGNVYIDLKVRVQYGHDVERVIKALQTDIQRSIEMMVDFKEVMINVSVVGFKFN